MSRTTCSETAPCANQSRLTHIMELHSRPCAPALPNAQPLPRVAKRGDMTYRKRDSRVDKPPLALVLRKNVNWHLQRPADGAFVYGEGAKAQTSHGPGDKAPPMMRSRCVNPAFGDVQRTHIRIAYCTRHDPESLRGRDGPRHRLCFPTSTALPRR